MPQEILVRAVHQGGMHFVASTADHQISIDYPLQPGKTAGPTPLELLLAGLAACGGSTVALLLQRMQQPLIGLEVEARGTRREEHPTILTDISLEFVVHGAGLKPEAVSRALTLAEEQLCPVWAMLRSGTAISAAFRLVED